ncbi:Crp/Fnr family transcriptional regulator [Paenibacillus silvisoli]|uniref:Crp/Fnr family transcriptional regulator n=1 Tax=Paenibacillus silvisoli TaxID=3110539 RepID=UPI0028045C4A|nr:Crp/Fnr family transcriptional regulator [Paenibacillus silvisoli]
MTGMHSMKNTTATMSSVREPIFSAEQFDLLQSIMQMKAVKDGAHLYWEGDASDSLYYVKQGQVRITKSADNGRTLTLYQHVPGDLFGQLDPFRNSAHGFNAVAMENCQIGIMKHKDIETQLQRNGELAVAFMKWLGLTHRMTQMKLRDLMMFGKAGALCSLLIRLNNTFGKARGGKRVITLKLTNAEMADMIGTTRESVNRLLSDMKKEGIISIEDGFLCIEKLEFLRESCSCEGCPDEICRM